MEIECPKCGSGRILKEHHENCPERATEHLHCFCRECFYAWTRMTLDEERRQSAIVNLEIARAFDRTYFGRA